ncbi:hypothetical protein AGMMS49921_14040 [Endomicrobiia bacterium]|nr:hypothetical protein AGMMS49921_14040 [Endomicrobiia bacterium]
MKCESKEQFFSAMNTLIAGSSGATREALTSMRDWARKNDLGDVVVKLVKDDGTEKVYKSEIVQ